MQVTFTFNMVFSSSDKAIIETCFVEKGWRGSKIVQEFPGKKWRKRSVNKIIKRLGGNRIHNEKTREWTA